MSFTLKEKGKSYLLPFEGFEITGINLNGGIGIELCELSNSKLLYVIDIMTNFSLTKFNQEETLNPFDIKSIKKILDLMGQKIKKSDCTKTGDLFLTLDNGTLINVPDSEYEGWHISIIQQERIKNTLIIGGVGMTSYFNK